MYIYKYMFVHTHFQIPIPHIQGVTQKVKIIRNAYYLNYIYIMCYRN